MPRTQFLKPYIDRVDALNDQLWYFLFISEELNQRLSKLANPELEKFTTELFPSNSHAFRIHVKAKDLINHQNENKRITYGSYISTAYEIAANYVHDVFDFLKISNHLISYTWNKSKPPEINLKSLLDNNGILSYPTYIIDTFGYLRLRRNHFTHLILTPNSALTEFMLAHGSSLEVKWKDPGIVNNLNFLAISTTSDFTLEETIDMFKILRICINELDEYISSILNRDSLIKFIVQREYGGKKTRMNNEVLEERTKKIISIANYHFGVILNPSECESQVRIIGVK